MAWERPTLGLVEVVHVAVEEGPRVGAALLTDEPGDERGGRGVPISADLVPVEDECLIVADLQPLDVLGCVRPGQTRLVLQQLPGEVVGHPIHVVIPRHSVTLAADPPVVPPLADHDHLVVDGKRSANHLNQQTADVHVLSEQGLVDLVWLGRKIEDALDHVPPEDDNCLSHGVILALNLGDEACLVAVSEHPFPAYCRAVGRVALGVLPVAEIPDRHLGLLPAILGWRGHERHLPQREEGIHRALMNGVHHPRRAVLGIPKLALEPLIDPMESFEVFGYLELRDVGHFLPGLLSGHPHPLGLPRRRCRDTVPALTLKFHVANTLAMATWLMSERPKHTYSSLARCSGVKGETANQQVGRLLVIAASNSLRSSESFISEHQEAAIPPAGG